MRSNCAVLLNTLIQRYMGRSGMRVHGFSVLSSLRTPTGIIGCLRL